jgi:hypothetical protein
MTDNPTIFHVVEYFENKLDATSFKRVSLEFLGMLMSQIVGAEELEWGAGGGREVLHDEKWQFLVFFRRWEGYKAGNGDTFQGLVGSWTRRESREYCTCINCSRSRLRRPHPILL